MGGQAHHRLSMPLADYQNLVADMVRDDTGKLTAADIDEAIQLAVERYSKDRPLTVVEDLVAAAGYVLAMPAAWDADFSDILSIEYPIDERPKRCFLDSGDYWIYDLPAGTQQIEFVDSLPAGVTLRVSHSVKHTLDGATESMPAGDREPIAAWAAAVLLDQLASLFSGDSDSTLQADNVDHQSKASEFASRASRLRRRYHDELGIDPKRNVAAGAIVNLDQKNSLGGTRLTHRG